MSVTLQETPQAKPSLLDGEFVLTQADFSAIAALLATETGIILHDGKAAQLYSRLGKRLRSLGLTHFSDYRALLDGASGQAERRHMIEALTTNVTRFFREPHHFDHLREVVLPPLLRAAELGGRVRLWSAACSTGEEPYSLAMTVLRLLPGAAKLDVRILATDIDTTVLAHARDGRYGAQAIALLPAALRDTWFVRDGSGWQIGEALRELVAFRPLNLIGPWPMQQRFDAVLCRNVLIYFAEPTQASIAARFTQALKPGGVLYLGHSERLPSEAAASFANVGVTTYQRVAA